MLSASEIIGDFGFKGVARNPTIANWSAGFIGYVGVIYFLIKSLETGNVMYTNGMWDGISAIISTIAAFFIFGERLNSPVQYVGLCVVIVGIMLLKSGGIPY